MVIILMIRAISSQAPKRKLMEKVQRSHGRAVIMFLHDCLRYDPSTPKGA